MPHPGNDASQQSPDLKTLPPGAADDDEVESKPGLGENQAGFLKDRDGASTGRDKDQG